MPTLLFDLGNTRLKWAWLEDGTLRPGGALVHGGDLGPQSLDGAIEAGQPDRVIAAAVAAEALVVGLADWLDRRWHCVPQWAATEADGLGLVNAYAQPASMGVDRWLAMAGARGRTQAGFCVIDAGTAITVDQVDAKGRHLGGWIAPGHALMRQTLTRSTGRIGEVDPSAGPPWGRNTADCVSAGVDNALAGLLQRAVEMGRSLHGGDPEYFVTGGDARRVLQWLEPAATLAPDLVLEGLARWAAAHPEQ